MIPAVENCNFAVAKTSNDKLMIVMMIMIDFQQEKYSDICLEFDIASAKCEKLFKSRHSTFKLNRDKHKAMSHL